MFGPRAAAGRAAIVNADANIRLLVEALRDLKKWERALLFVLSDYSFLEAGEQLHAEPGGVQLAVGNLVSPHLDELFGGVCKSPGARAEVAWVSFGGAVSVYVTDAGHDAFAGTPLSAAQRGCLMELRTLALAREGVEEAVYRLPVEGDTGLLDALHPEWRMDTPRAGELILTVDYTHGFLASLTSLDAATPGVHGGPAAQPIAFLLEAAMSRRLHTAAARAVAGRRCRGSRLPRYAGSPRQGERSRGRRR